MRIKTALLSVADKRGIIEFARNLDSMGVQILSTGGTARALENAGVRVRPVADYTGFPEILDGRVKTLHPKIHGGLLARHDLEKHQQTLKEYDIEPITLVAVNLYPFSKTVAREGVTLEEAVEQVDIGGPAMVRAAAKNFNTVTVIVDPGDYARIFAEIETNAGQTKRDTRFQLCLKAFDHTAAYDSEIAAYFANRETAERELPRVLTSSLVQANRLRYGENPHQRAALYRPRFQDPSGLVAAEQHQGKELSFNNYVDLEAAWSLSWEFDKPFCAIVKHTNPCGAAVGETLALAYDKALATDPVSAFGSVIGFNRRVDVQVAQRLTSLFVEAVIAPGYDPEALEILSKRKNLRVMKMSASASDREKLDFKKIEGGFLVQDKDVFYTREEDLKVVTRRSPSAEELKDLLFAWNVCKHVKSNAIVFARDGQTVGVGAGQMSRVDSVRLAGTKAILSVAGTVMASDAFFPFRDGVDEAAQAGVTAVIQPGGSLRDQEVIDAADEHEVAMVLTGVRHFKH